MKLNFNVKFKILLKVFKICLHNFLLEIIHYQFVNLFEFSFHISLFYPIFLDYYRLLAPKCNISENCKICYEI